MSFTTFPGVCLIWVIFVIYPVRTILSDLPDDCEFSQVDHASIVCRIDPLNVTNYLETLATRNPEARAVTFRLKVFSRVEMQMDARFNLTSLQKFNNVTNFTVDCDTGCLKQFEANDVGVELDFTRTASNSLPSLQWLVLRYRKNTVSIKTFQPFSDLFSSCPNLLVLDLSESSGLFSQRKYPDNLLRYDVSIRMLNLSNFQGGIYMIPAGATTFNFSLLNLQMAFPQSLEILDISRNGYTYLCGDMQRFLNLKILELSYNNIHQVERMTTLQFFLHPNLEIVSADLQTWQTVDDDSELLLTTNTEFIATILGSPLELEVSPQYLKLYNFTFAQELFVRIGVHLMFWSDTKIRKSVNNSYFTKITEEMAKLSLQLTKNGIWNLSESVDNETIVEVFSSLTNSSSEEEFLQDCIDGNTYKICSAVNKIFIEKQHVFVQGEDGPLYLPCDLMPNIFGFLFTYDSNCYPPFNLPFIRKVKQIRLRNVHMKYDTTTFNYMANSTKGICFMSPSMNSLDLSSSKRIQYLQGAFTVTTLYENLQALVLNDNNFDLDSTLNAWSSPTIKYLSLSGSTVHDGGLLDVDICKYLPSLERIDLPKSRITHVYTSALKSCASINHVDLSRNNIHTFDVMTTVRESIHNVSNAENTGLLINLSSNALQYISNDVLNYLDTLNEETGGVTLDLSLNPIDCSCERRYFLKWLQQTNVNLHEKDFYQCSSDGTYVTKIDLHRLDIKCRPTYIVVIIAVCSTLLVILTVFLLIYLCNRYRYRLITLFYRINTKHRSAANNYEYDAYLCYASEDRFWTHDILVPKLEGEYGFRLCVHYRDFPVGGYIEDRICEFMSKSRTIVVVLTEQAIQKNWFLFEVRNAQMLMLSNGTKVVFIQQCKIDYSILPESLRALVDVMTILPWPEVTNPTRGDDIEQDVDSGKTSRAREIFWYKLRLALHDRDDVRCHDALEMCCCMNCWYNKYAKIRDFADVEVVMRPQTSQPDD